jgi:hypothetical protein
VCAAWIGRDPVGDMVDTAAWVTASQRTDNQDR